MQIKSFVGSRPANMLDTVGQSPTASLQTVVSRSCRGSSRGTRQVTRAMFERFTEKAIKVVMLAQEEARRLGGQDIHTLACIPA